MSLFDDFINLLYPKYCASCENVLHTTERNICLACKEILPRTNFHNQPENAVEKTFWGRVEIEEAAAFLYFQKEGLVQNLLHNIKYKGTKEAAYELGLWYGNDLKKDEGFGETNVVIPVPLHKSKKRKRGYNQSEWFASGLAESMQAELRTENLVRGQASQTQTRKSRFERWKNVEEVFMLKDPEAIKNCNILLVDDVITTGATIEACAQTIFAVNCSCKIRVAAIAFAN
ncbi:MAG: ComF family protein [Sphingobacteriales bacterium]|nr:MAG: ComF family protein [Sphingobacteriales bacterium]